MNRSRNRLCLLYTSILTLLFEWESLEKARVFLASDELKSKMASAGVKGPPRVDLLDEVHSVRRSAAD